MSQGLPLSLKGTADMPPCIAGMPTESLASELGSLNHATPEYTCFKHGQIKL
jgi:hypothetical protein